MPKINPVHANAGARTRHVDTPVTPTKTGRGKTGGTTRPRRHTGRGLDAAADATPPRHMVLTSLPPPVAVPPSIKVVEAYDGDTLTLANGVHVRVHGINTTEMKSAHGAEPFAELAGEFTRKLLVGKKVDLTDPSGGGRMSDDYGRMVLIVKRDGEDLAEKLAEQGLGHVYIIPDGNNSDDGERYGRLIAAQKRAKDARRGIWGHDWFKGQKLFLTSFHGNGKGNDKANPNVEYLRVANISEEPLALGGYTMTNKAGRTFTLPEVTLPPGYTISISSGKGVDLTDVNHPLQIFLQSDTEVWENTGDQFVMRDPAGNVIMEEEYTGRDLADLTKLPDPVSQSKLRTLGADTEVEWRCPARISAKGYKDDDGDTIFIPSPAPGTFKAKIGEVERDVLIADQKQTPPGMLSIRFLGLDTPETHVMGKDDEGKPISVSQGRPAEIAAEMLAGFLAKAKKVEVEPNAGRPFDVYDRLLGWVWVTMKDGKQLLANAWMIEQGGGEFSMHFNEDFDMERWSMLSAASKIAYEGKRGIYSDGEGRCDVRPSQFRKFVQRRNSPSPYVIDMIDKKVYTAKDADARGLEPWKRLAVFRDRVNDAVEKLGLTLDAGVKL
jgi:endonuclease YncB( thermonuclease family)